MANIYGADVAQLRALAAAFQRASDELERNRAIVANQIQISAWTGPSAASFRHSWQSDHARKVSAAAHSLAESAEKLRGNANDQDRASAGGGGQSSGSGWFAGPGVPTLPGGASRYWAADEQPEMLDRLTTLLGHELQGAELIAVLKEIADVKAGVLAASPLLNKLLGPLGLALEGRDLVENFAKGNIFGGVSHAVSGTLSLASYVGSFGAVGSVMSRLSPLSAGVAALNTFIDITLPVTGEEQTGTVAMGARHLFGNDVSLDSLTAEQGKALASRYSGGFGWAYMISDTMDESARTIFPWNKK